MIFSQADLGISKKVAPCQGQSQGQGQGQAQPIGSRSNSCDSEAQQIKHIKGV